MTDLQGFNWLVITKAAFTILNFTKIIMFYFCLVNCLERHTAFLRTIIKKKKNLIFFPPLSCQLQKRLQFQEVGLSSIRCPCLARESCQSLRQLHTCFPHWCITLNKNCSGNWNLDNSVSLALATCISLTKTISMASEAEGSKHFHSCTDLFLWKKCNGLKRSCQNLTHLLTFLDVWMFW